jgi:predicted small integral membrane protein
LFFSLTVLNNLTDYSTNFVYVQNILLMNSIYPTSTLTWRAIANPRLHHFFFQCIIAWELLSATLCWIGTVQLALTLRAKADVFNLAKSFTLSGLLVASLLWLGGFLCIGGEWFAMWQSPTWNGQTIAFQLFTITTLAFIFVRKGDS